MGNQMEQFHCLRCGNCCRWPGAVRVGEAEIDAIAAYLGIPLEQFLTEYTELLPDRTGLTLPEKPDGSCCFLEEGEPARCRIDPVKPVQCRRFPEHWNFPGWEKECAAGKAPAAAEKQETGSGSSVTKQMPHGRPE